MADTTETAVENQDKVGLDPTKPLGEVVKQTQDGTLPVGTLEQLMTAAPRDIVEEVLPIPEWSFSVKVRSFTAAQSARIKNTGFQQRGDRIRVDMAAMEIAQLAEGVIEPRLSDSDARKLHTRSGLGVAKIIQWLDDNSGTNKEAIREAEARFQEEGE